MGCNHFANGLCVLPAPRLRPGSGTARHGVLNTGESPFPRGRLGGIRPISVNCRQQPYGEDQTSRGEFVMDRCGGPMRRPRRAACLAPDLSLSAFHGPWSLLPKEPLPRLHTLDRLSIRNGEPILSSILRPARRTVKQEFQRIQKLRTNMYSRSARIVASTRVVARICIAQKLHGVGDWQAASVDAILQEEREFSASPGITGSP